MVYLYLLPFDNGKSKPYRRTDRRGWSLYSRDSRRPATNLNVGVCSDSGQRCNDAGRTAQLKIPRRKATVKTASDRRASSEQRPRPDDRPRPRLPRRRGRVDSRRRSRHHGPTSDRSLHGGCDGRADVGRRCRRVDHADDSAIWFTHLQVRTAVIYWLTDCLSYEYDYNAV